jgi:hypothetical protein
VDLSILPQDGLSILISIFVTVIFGILLSIGVAILSYIIYDYFVMKEQFDRTPVKDIFWKEYHKVKRERLESYK